MTLLKNKMLLQGAGIAAIVVGVGAFWMPDMITSLLNYSIGPVSVSMAASGLVIALGLDVFM